MRLSFLLCAAALVSVSASAQTGSLAPLSGTVLDATDGSPLPGATVRLVRATPDSAATGAATGADGAFRLAAAPGAYRLRVSFIGYTTLEQAVTLGATPLALGELRLSPDDNALGEARVTGLRQRVEVRGDTTAFNAAAFAVNPDADAGDLVAKLPGVTVENGTVTAQGETVQRVLIDGREFFGSDVQGALKSLPAEVIQEVQVYDRPSEASRFSGFDDGNAEKTINIVTSAATRNGQFGRVYGGAGPDGEYLAGGNVSLLSGDRRVTIVGLTNNVDQQNFATEDLLGAASGVGRGGGGRPGGGSRGDRGGGGRGGDIGGLLVGEGDGIHTTNALGVTVADKLLGGTVDVTGSYVFNTTDTDLNASLRRAYTTGDIAQQLYAETTDAASTNTTHRLNARAQATLGERTQLVVEPRVSYQGRASAQSLLGVTSLETGSPLAQTATTADADGQALSAQTSVLLRQRLGAAGRTVTLGLDGSLSNQDGTSRQQFVASSVRTDAEDVADQLFLTDGPARSLGGQIGYTEPLGGRAQLQLSYRPQLSWSTADQRATLADGAGAFTLPDSAYTSLFEQRSLVQRAGASVRLGSGGGGRGEGGAGGTQGGRDAGLSAQIGLDVQHERLDAEQTVPTAYTVDRTFWSVLPSARVQLGLGAGRRLSLDYRARTQTPSARQLQDVVDNSNPLLLTAGNPELEPSTTHSLRARFNSTDAQGGAVLAGFLSGSVGVNAFGQSTVLATTDTEIAPGIVLPAGSQLTRPENVDGALNGRALVSYGRPVSLLRSNANVSLGASVTRAPGLVNGLDNVSSQLGIDGRVFIGSAASTRFDASLEYGARYSSVSNTSSPTLDATTVRHLAAGKLTYLPGSGLVLSTDLQGLVYTGLDDSVDPTQILWGARLGYKFLSADAAELSLSVADILAQQRDVERTTTDLYVQDSQTRSLGRYVLLNLSYKLRNFGV